MTAEMSVQELHRKMAVFNDVVAGKLPYSALAAELVDAADGERQINWLWMAVQDQIFNTVNIRNSRCFPS